jgi:predicted Zn-dependent peptidase
MLCIQAGLDTGKIDAAIRAIYAELDGFCQSPPSAKALGQAKDYLIGQTELTLESPSNQMSHMGESLCEYGRILDPNEEEESLLQVTAEGVQSMAQQLFRTNNLALAIVAPEESTAVMERAAREPASQLLVA